MPEVELKRKHPSRPFNPEVANAFFRAGMIETWGRGIERIMDACRSANLPEPDLRSESSGLWIDFDIPTATTQEHIVALLKTTPSMTRRELAEKTGVSENGVKYHLNKLKASGVLRHIGPTKAGRWEILK